MALVKLRDFIPATDGKFITQVSTFEAGITATPPTHRRVLITSDDGTCQGYERIADGSLFCGALVAPTSAKQAADSTATAAASADASKTLAAMNEIRDQVARVRPVAAGSRSDQDKWLLALSWVLLKRE